MLKYSPTEQLLWLSNLSYLSTVCWDKQCLQYVNKIQSSKDVLDWSRCLNHPPVLCDAVLYHIIDQDLDQCFHFHQRASGHPLTPGRWLHSLTSWCCDCFLSCVHVTWHACCYTPFLPSVLLPFFSFFFSLQCSWLWRLVGGPATIYKGGRRWRIPLFQIKHLLTTSMVFLLLFFFFLEFCREWRSGSLVFTPLFVS